MAEVMPRLTLDANITPLKMKLLEATGELKRFGKGDEIIPLKLRLLEATGQLKDFRREAKNASSEVSSEFEKLHARAANTLAGLFSLGAMASFIKSTKDAVTQAEASFRGLEAVANYAGVGIGRAMEEAGKLAADGLMTTAEASKALQNLLSRGYSLDQAVATLTRLKDAAAFNRAAHLSMGEAVVTATEGLKNENSVLVDNAGVTKNVSKMWEEYADKLGKSANDLTQAEKIQAEYNGVMAETEAQLGNAAKAAEGMQGQQARLAAETQNLKIAIGQGLTPAFTALMRAGSFVVENFAKPVMWYFEALGIRAGALATKIGILWDAVTDFNFAGLGAKLNAANALKEEMITEAAARYSAPMSGFEALGDSGRRRDPNALNAGGGGKSKKGGGKAKAKKEQEPIDVFGSGSFIAGSKEAADFIKAQYEAVNDLQRDIAKEAEKAAQKVVDADKRAAAEFLQLNQLRATAARDEAMSRIDQAMAAAQFEVDIGNMTNADLLALKAQFNQRRLEIEQQYLDAKRELMLQDPDANPLEFERIELEKEEIRRRYAAQSLEIQRQTALESEQVWSDLGDRIGGLWDKGIQALINGTLTWRGAFKAIGAEVVGWFANNVIGTMVKDWLAGQVKKLAILLGFTAQEKAAQKLASGEIMATKATEASSVVGANAVEAGSGAAASQASIPYVGPILALAAMAAVFAAVSALGKKKSAAGGYDIPRGINPMTQLHTEEMVLPAHLANAVRTMAAKGMGEGADEGASSAMQPVNVNITSPNARGVRELFLENPDVLAEAIRKAVRNGFK